MKLSQRQLLKAAACLMLLTTVFHTVGNLTPSSDATVIEFEKIARGLNIDAGLGMRPNMFDIHMVLVFVMSLTFSGLGILNLVLASASDVSDRLIRPIVAINAAWVGGFIVLCWFYRIPPPLISGILIGIPLALALATRGAE